MNYELAKELKDAGFPQEIRWGQLLHDSTCDWGETRPACDQPYAPTLEEIIEACGPRLWMITRTNGGNWLASEESVVSPINSKPGSTPTIAVARLWLALNTK